MPVLSEPLVDQLLESVRGGVPPETAIIAAGLSPRSYYEWMQVAQSGTWQQGSTASEAMRSLCMRLYQGIASARAEHEAEMLQAIREASQTVGKSGVREWRAGAWYLEHAPHTKDRWGQQVQVNQQVTITDTQRQVRALSDTELEQLVQADDAPALPAPSSP